MIVDQVQCFIITPFEYIATKPLLALHVTARLCSDPLLPVIKSHMLKNTTVSHTKNRP